MFDRTIPALLKILVADDDRITQLVLKNFFSKKGYSIIEAMNGAEAIEIFDRERPDLILMDVSMPEMTGYEAAMMIKQKSGNRFTPIIFLTALDDDASLVKCIESGGDDFLAKPINMILLEAKIIAMMRISQMSKELEAYKIRTEEEIELTHCVFDSLTKRRSVPSVPGMGFWLRSASHFSGDLLIYDVSPSGTLCLMLGDFTGHGFSAAIGAVPTSDIFFAMTRRDFKAVDILTEINRKLHEIMPTTHFCATAFIRFLPKANQIEVFNGGLPPIMLLEPSGQVKTYIESSSLPLGILPSAEFEAEIRVIENIHDHTLLVYTDGVIEAQNHAGEMFGADKLYAALRVGENPIHSVKSALERFIGNNRLNDDISLVSLNLT